MAEYQGTNLKDTPVVSRLFEGYKFSKRPSPCCPYRRSYRIVNLPPSGLFRPQVEKWHCG